MADTDVLAGEWNSMEGEETPGTEEGQVPAVVEDKPAEVEHEAPLSREALESEAALEGETATLVDEVVGKDEITLADLRTFPQSKGLTDDDLIEIAAQAGLKIAGVHPLTEAKETGKEVAPARTWKTLDKAGKEVTNLTRVSAADFLKNGKIAYRAMNTDQIKTIDEVVRLAQRGHLDEAQRTQLAADRVMLSQQLMRAGAEVKQANMERAAWNSILADQTGNSFLKAQERYFQELAKGPTAPTAPSPAELEARGVVFYQQNIMPALVKIQETYPTVKLDEVDKVARYLIEQEPIAQLDPNTAWERIKYIVNVRIPQMIEESGHMAVGNTVPTQVVPSVGTSVKGPDKAAELRLRAENANLKRQLSKSKLGRAPGGVSRRGNEESGEATTNNLDKLLEGKNSAEARDILRKYKG